VRQAANDPPLDRQKTTQKPVMGSHDRFLFVRPTSHRLVAMAGPIRLFSKYPLDPISDKAPPG
jgi:hypothetical protein